MSSIQSGAPHHLLQIAVETLPQLPVIVSPAFLVTMLPACLVPLLVKSAGAPVSIGTAGTDATKASATVEPECDEA